jgi:hypothetical protein
VDLNGENRPFCHKINSQWHVMCRCHTGCAPYVNSVAGYTFLIHAAGGRYGHETRSDTVREQRRLGRVCEIVK